MKSGIKIIHWICFLWLSLLISGFDLLLGHLALIFNYIVLIFNQPSSFIIYFDFGFIDHLLSVLIFIIIIPLVILINKNVKLFNVRLNFTFAFLVLLCFVLLFAPLITDENPEFSKNLSVTKLLPPFSSVKQIELRGEKLNYQSEEKSFKNKLEKIIKPAFNDNLIFADSVVFPDNEIVYYQKNQSYKINILLSGYEPKIEDKFFLFGTDEFGRDLFARLIYGTRLSITIGLGAVLISFVIGIFLGFLSGYIGGITDIVFNRFTEMFLAFPVIYLIVLILALFGNSIFSVIVVLGISGWMSLFKIVKSEVLSIKQKDYLSSAELIGLSKYQLLRKEIFPVIITPVLVNLIFLFSNVILAEAALSYLGLGSGSSYPSWGSMISSGQEYLTKAWWLIAFPGSALLLTLFTFNTTGKYLGKRIRSGMKS